MYRNAYQRGMLTIFFSGGAKPLKIWDVYTKDGYISRFLDQEIKSMVLEIGGTNVSTTYISCPKGNVVLGITMPFLVMIVKNLKKYFSFEVTILDETSTRRRFRVSNFQSTTQILPLCTAMPIGLSDGWNQIQFNLAEFTRRAYKKQFVEVQKLKINANIRLRRIYFTERLLPEDELPPEFKLYFPLQTKGTKDKKTVTENTADKENIKPSTSLQQAVKGPETAPVEEKVKSETRFAKSRSKISVHSIKKAPSHISGKLSKASFTAKEGETVASELIPEHGASEHIPEQGASEQIPVQGASEQIPQQGADAEKTAENQPSTEENVKTAEEEQPPPEGTEPAAELTEIQTVASEGELNAQPAAPIEAQAADS